MSTASHPNPGGERRRRSHDEPNGWKSIPLAVKILGALCVTVLILIPVAKQKGWFQHHATIQEQPAPSDRFTSGDLEVTTARLDPQTRTIKGRVSNKSSSTYDDVQVSFDVRHGMPVDAGPVYARLGRIPPHSFVDFETTRLSPIGTEWELRELSGTKR
jgi:hypothetical protein